jgi:hypothetical protein
MLVGIKNDVDRFKEYDNKKREAEYNGYVQTINAKLIELGDDMIKINE